MSTVGACRDLHSTALSGTLPETVCQLPSLSSLDLHSCRLDAVASLADCGHLAVLDVSNNRLAALPPALPPSLTHLYINGNPLTLSAANLSGVLANTGRLAALDIQFLNAPLILSAASDADCLAISCYGPRVAAPGACVLGNATACRWTLQLYDAWDEPCHVGGLVQNLTLGMSCDSGIQSCEQVAPMADQRNGSFVAQVGDGWVRSTGRVQFRFYHGGEEFRPRKDAAGQNAGYDSLRTLEFEARKDCPSHSAPDSTGYTCDCKSGYKRENREPEALSCILDCPRGQVNLDGTCVCPRRSYNASAVGFLRCSASEWNETDTASTASMGDQCLPCPECAQCEDGEVSLRQGWRLADHAFQGAVLTAFRCPYAEVTTNDADVSCPPIVLPVNMTQPPCRDNHTGELCAVCEPHFTRHASSDNRCELCSTQSYSEAMFGISRWWLATAAVLVVLLLGAVLWYTRQKLMELKALVYVHIRILVGWAQVLSLLSGVLDIVYPSRARTALGTAALLVADLRGFVRLDCLGWTWYAKWFAALLGIPAVLLGIVGLRFAWSRRQQHAAAKAEAVRACFFVAMLLYPQLSSTIFSALRCRRLGPTTSVLEADYSIYCSDSDFTPIRVMAWVLVFVVPLGFPAMLLWVLWRRWRSGHDAEAAHQRVTEAYGFCVDDYRPGCWMFEPVDMIRKLALTGLLQFVQRGTATQVFCGCALAFLSSGLQVHFHPYREAEANVLKTLVDAQIFLTFLLSFLLRVLPRLELQAYEPLSAEFYGWVLLLSVVGLLVAAAGLTARRLRRGGLGAAGVTTPLLGTGLDTRQASLGGSE